METSWPTVIPSPYWSVINFMWAGWDNVKFLLKKILEGRFPFCEAAGTPVLDFLWRQPLISKSGWIPLLAYFVACVLCRLRVIDSPGSDSLAEHVSKTSQAQAVFRFSFNHLSRQWKQEILLLKVLKMSWVVLKFWSSIGVSSSQSS